MTFTIAIIAASSTLPSSIKKESSLSVPAPPLSKPSPSTSAPANVSSAKEPVAKSDLKPAAPIDLPPSPPQIAAPALPKSIGELEVALAIAAKTAIQEYDKAIRVLKM